VFEVNCPFCTKLAAHKAPGAPVANTATAEATKIVEKTDRISLPPSIKKTARERRVHMSFKGVVDDVFDYQRKVKR
jgi:hypothetical protein